MNIAIFDDEQFFCQQINNILEEFFMNEYPKMNFKIQMFSDEKSFEGFVNKNEIKVVFLDISTRNNENYGLEVARYIRTKSESVHIIFVTSLAEKISDVFDDLIRPSQFFVKPVSAQKIFNIMHKVMRRFVNSQDYITVKFGRMDCIIKINEIYYAKKIDRKTQITLSNRSIQVRNSLSKVCESLPDQFVSIDKGVVVNIEMIRDIDYGNGQLVLNNGQILDISRSSKKVLRNLLKN